MSKKESVKMRFSKDQYYLTAANREEDLKTPLYQAGQVYEIEPGMIARWLKRGGEIVTDEILEQEAKLQKELAKEMAKDLAEEVKAKVEDEPQDIAPVTEEHVETLEKKAEDEAKPETHTSHKSHKGHKHKR